MFGRIRARTRQHYYSVLKDASRQNGVAVFDRIGRGTRVKRGCVELEPGGTADVISNLGPGRNADLDSLDQEGL
jgi:hypothetical protein